MEEPRGYQGAKIQPRGPAGSQRRLPQHFGFSPWRPNSKTPVGFRVRPYQPPPVQKCSHKNNSRLCELTAVARQGRDLALSDCTLLCCTEIWCLNVSRSIWKHLPGGTCPKFKGLALKVEQNHIGNPGEGSGETLLQTGQRWQEAPWAGLPVCAFFFSGSR